MNAIEFLGEWAVRSSVLIAAGALLLLALRVKDSSIRLAVWVALLFGSLVIPLMTVTLSPVSVTVAPPVAAPVVDFVSAPVAPLPVPAMPFDWARAGLVFYVAVCGGLLLRLVIGLVMSRRLLRGSRATAESGIRESEQVRAPVTLGIWRPVIVLPLDWREWDSARLDAVLAHERSHIGRFDPTVQLLSAVHRSALWFSPVSWFLHSRIVRVAEEASDDAAMAVTRDRASYAELLLEFMQRGVCSAGVPMARYGRMDARIRRVLDGKVLSRGLTWRSVAAIVALGSPLAYVVAMAQPGARGPAPAVKTPQRSSGFLPALGAVSAVTVTVAPRIEGQLMSVSFREGEAVREGQVIAIVASAESAVARGTDEEIAANQQHLVDMNNAGRITAPIAGVAGLRMVEPGNMVRPGEILVTIAQIQPIAVVFSIPEDWLAKVRSRMSEGAGSTVEAWNRDSTAKLATGHLTAIDNQIDEQTGTVKLKATFDNKDSALFPNQFVNVRLLMQ